MITADTAVYLRRVVELLDGGLSGRVPTRCPECEAEMDLSTEYGHIVWRHPDTLQLYVVIGCEGYWCIDPARVGLPRGNWMAPDDQATIVTPDEVIPGTPGAPVMFVDPARLREMLGE